HKAARPRIRPALLVALVALAIVAGLVIVRSVGSDKTPARRPVPKPPSVAAAVAAQPAAARVSPVGGVPMSLVSSSVTGDASSHTYKATITIRNPTDVPATGVTVRATLKDAGGHVVATRTRASRRERAAPCADRWRNRSSRPAAAGIRRRRRA